MQIGSIATGKHKRHPCRTKMIRWLFTMTLAFAFALVFGSVGCAFLIKSAIVDNQGAFTQSATIKSEDGKVQLYIAKGTTIKVTPGKTEDGKTPILVK